MTEVECERTVLARGPCTELARCSCGHVHLTVGPVTLRLDDTVLAALLLTLHEGVPRLDEARRMTAAGVPVLVTGFKQ